MGNPTSYKGTTFGWSRGRLLTSATQGSKSITMGYNVDGVRCTKTVTTGSGIVSSTYHYEGANLMHEVVTKNGTTTNRKYLYNSQGIVGFIQDDVEYIYHKNIFGDIVAIYNGSTKVAEYAYDAYGRSFIKVDIDGIATSNPFRYRSYYWDSDLSLYYLISRYYDPATSRFINTDSLEYLDPESIHGLNLFAYCGNNPVMYVDRLGYSAILTGLLIFIGIMTLIGATYGGISAGVTGGSAEDVFAGIGKGALNGLIIAGGISLVIGGFAVGGSTILGSTMITYGTSVTANMLEVAVTQGKKSFYDGDSFWAGANDVNNAMFANSGDILMGKFIFKDIPIYGTRIISKIPTIANILVTHTVLNIFEHSTLAMSAKTALFSQGNMAFMTFGYFLTALQLTSLFQAICTTPDFENSKWILY